jgi:hypothetical protein
MQMLRACSWVGSRSLAWITTVLLASAAQGVVISSGTGTGNSTPPTPPADDFGFENVGVTDTGLSGMYLGGGWVITAGHVGARPITLLGVTYQPVAGSGAQVPNPSGPPPDLMVYRINGFPPLPSPVLSNATPTVGEVVSCEGHGWPREPTETLTTWSATWQENPPPPQVLYRGFKRTFAVPHVRRWGTNAVSVEIIPVPDTTNFQMVFNQTGGTPDEAQAVTGDSGGACFAERGGNWELVGVMFAMLVFSDGPGGNPDQPANTAVFGNGTVVADVFFYRTQIESLTPPIGAVPALPPLAVGALALLLVLTASAGYLRPSSTRR